MAKKSICFAIALLASFPHLAWGQDIDRPGKGQWCYDPVRPVTEADKRSFLAEIEPAAIMAERRWGVPAPILAGMAIVESGYGLTRLALKANNVLAFKWPGKALARGAAPFTLECQPVWDKGDVYPSFAKRADAVDFVAWRLKDSQYYSAATSRYAKRVAAGEDFKTAATEWLQTIAPTYNYDAKTYVPHVLAAVASPMGSPGHTLWELRP